MRDPDTVESQQTILVVDDEQDILDLVATNLRRTGFSVATASGERWIYCNKRASAGCKNTANSSPHAYGQRRGIG